MQKMKPEDAKLLQAISEHNLDEVRKWIASGADPNTCDSFGDSALKRACDGQIPRDARHAMAKTLIEAGADPNVRAKDGSGPLFPCVIAKDVELLEYLLLQGADPNQEHDDGEYLYDWAEFDYRNDEFGLNFPEEPLEEDTASEDTWISFYSRIALKYDKQPPVVLISLRKSGAVAWRERQDPLA